VLPASAGDVARDFALPGGLVAGGIITAFHVLAIFVETPLLAFSERVSVRIFSATALAVLAVASLGAALSGSVGVLLACLALYGPASGCALSASEGLLVESRPLERERTLARLNLAGALGDLSVPGLLGAFAWLGLGWRHAIGIAALVALGLAVVHGSSKALDVLPVSADDEDETPRVLEALRFAFSHRSLLGWSLAVSGTSLLDEVLIAFVMVRLEAASPVARAVVVAAWTVGLVGGLVVLERWIERLDSRRVLLVSACVAAAALVAVACAENVTATIAAAFVLGASTSTLHPLASARAYAALPGRPALVNAVAAAFVPLDAIAPLVLSAIALSHGSAAALLAILVAPLGIALAAWRRGEPKADIMPPA
jgi:FSR family fosmidomycin resistance protein-like MFS transporter